MLTHRNDYLLAIATANAHQAQYYRVWLASVQERFISHS